MNDTAQASKQYLRNAVLTATAEQLQLMLYDGAIRFASRAREGLVRRDYEAAFNGFERAQRIVVQMAEGMNRDVNPELVDQMASLYNFIHRRLVDANVQHDLDAVDDALRILRHQRETWMLLMEKIAKEHHGAAAPAKSDTAPGGATPAFSAEG